MSKLVCAFMLQARPTYAILINMKISVTAKTSSRVESVEKLEDGSFVVRVRVPPENGKANERICELLAEFFSKPKSAIAILAGHKSKRKIVSIGAPR